MLRERERERVVVFAAASLTESFTDIAERFEAENPDVDVILSFGATSELAAQIDQGAQADVFAAADEVNMERLVSSGAITGTPEVFARNQLAIIVEPGNPLEIATLEDLADESLIVALSAPDVPAGRYAAALLEEQGIELSPDSLEVDVKAVVTRIALGEADAGIVYVTDARAAGSGVGTVVIPDEKNVTALYPIASVVDSDAALRFVRFVLAEDGLALLEGRGFLAP